MNHTKFYKFTGIPTINDWYRERFNSYREYYKYEENNKAINSYTLTEQDLDLILERLK